MAVRTCEKCGEDNRENAKACVSCGESLKDTNIIGTKNSEKEKMYIYENDIDTTKCRLCGSDNIEIGYEISLCSGCREKLINRKIPTKIKVAAGFVLIIMLFSFTKLPTSINSGITYNKGIEAYKAKDYSNAMINFMKLRERYPSSNEIVGWIALTYFVEGNYEKSAEEFKKLPDKGLSSELNDEFEKAYQNLNLKDRK